MKFKLKKRATVVVASAVAAGLAVGGLAIASWLATSAPGSSGSAKALTAQALTTIDVSASSVASLYPGGSGPLLLKIHNPNPYPLVVTDISNDPSASITADSGHSGCTTANSKVSFANASSLNYQIAAGGDLTETTATNAVSMGSDSDNSCQGATFTIPVILSGHNV